MYNKHIMCRLSQLQAIAFAARQQRNMKTLCAKQHTAGTPLFTQHTEDIFQMEDHQTRDGRCLLYIHYTLYKMIIYNNI